MNHEPHTTDKHDFGEDCPDCGAMCADALEQLLEWVTYSERNRKLCQGRIAAIFVVTKRMKSAEACQQFSITKMTLHRNLKSLAETFGLRLENGKVL